MHKQRLLHHGTLYRVLARMPDGVREWWLTRLQYMILMDIYYHPVKTTRARAADVGCSQTAITHFLRVWGKRGLLEVGMVGRTKAARSYVHLNRGVVIEPPSTALIEPPTPRSSSYEGLTEGNTWSGWFNPDYTVTDVECLCLGKAPTQFCYEDGRCQCECRLHHVANKGVEVLRAPVAVDPQPTVPRAEPVVTDVPVLRAESSRSSSTEEGGGPIADTTPSSTGLAAWRALGQLYHGGSERSGGEAEMKEDA